jgi:hypothetical protein
MTFCPDFNTVLTAIGEPGAFGGNPPLWAEAMAARPAGLPAFLDPASLGARRSAAGLPPDRDPLLGAVARTVAADPDLLATAWYLHWRTFVAPENGSSWSPPALAHRLGEQAGAFYLLLALEFTPRLAAWHQRLGYPSDVTAETNRQIVAFESNHLRGLGRPGLYACQFPWLSVYLVDPYVRLGRFEYQLHVFGGGVHVWKRASDGHVIALAEEGARVAGDGLLLDPKAPADEGWTARLAETPGAITGFPVDPAGRILKNQLHLDPAAWKPCLRKGDMVLDLHIPAGGNMNWERMTDSFRQALDFFARHHSDRPFAALICTTWFLDPQLADLLPSDANLLRLQRATYLYPIAWGPGGLWFVFLQDPQGIDPSALPRHTSLQQAIASFLKDGGKWHCGGMFLMKEEMANPSENFYRECFRKLLPDI